MDGRELPNDFIFEVSDGKTRLTAAYPTTSDRQISMSGTPEDWTRKKWRKLLRSAEGFGRDDLLDKLKEMRDSAIKKRISEETPVFDDGSDEMPEAVHSLRVHFFQGDYIAVRGTATHEHRRELAAFGLRWCSEDQEWRGDFSEDLLRFVADYVEENDVVYDPDDIGYVWCGDCEGWKPE